MTVATALVSGNEPLPWLAEQAARDALKKSGLTHASGALLFLTQEFSHSAHHAQHAVTAVARVVQSTQVAGGIASGVFTEAGWVVDRPAAAVMVFGGGLALGNERATGDEAPALLSYAGNYLPPEWLSSRARFGANISGAFSDATSQGAPQSAPLVWQQARLNEPQRCSVQILGAQIDLAVSSGLKIMSSTQRVEQCNGFDLERLSGRPALRSLLSALPPDLRHQLETQLHHVVAIVLESPDEAKSAFADGYYRTLPIIAINRDQSLTLAERLAPGEQVCWAVRQPDSAEADMRDALDGLIARRRTETSPACALMFSCIGRGPYFYGGDDRDLALLCQRFPCLPVLGTYSTGQITPSRSGNRLRQNSVVTALISETTSCKEAHVQSIT